MLLLILTILTLPVWGCTQRSTPPDSSESATAATSFPPPPSSLTIGDPAPPLRIEQWMQGEAVAADDLRGKVHVVEFWATWCGPCLAGMPHLSELQDHYGDDVSFIGVTTEDAATVKAFLEKESLDGRPWKDVISYRVAIDAANWTYTAYMQAAGQNGIPCAFIVGPAGIVEWIGHPQQIDQPLASVVDGNWDRQQAIVAIQQQQVFSELSRQLAEYAGANQWDAALRVIDQAATEVGDHLQLDVVRLRVLEQAGREDEAQQVLQSLVEKGWSDPQLLNQIAWHLASGNGLSDLQTALRAANRATELTEQNDASVLDTLARVHFELGDFDEAIQWQRRAVAQSPETPQFEAALQQYLKTRPENTTTPDENPTPDDAEPASDTEPASDPTSAAK